MAVPSIQQPMTGLLMADATKDMFIISREIKTCYSDYGWSLQQIETALRAYDCFTHLIARKRNASHGPDLSFELPQGTVRTYHLFISTKSKEKVMQEILEESASYDVNFEKLRDTGFIFASPFKPLAGQFNSGTLRLTHDGFTRHFSDLSISKKS